MVQGKELLGYLCAEGVCQCTAVVAGCLPWVSAEQRWALHLLAAEVLAVAPDAAAALVCAARSLLGDCRDDSRLQLLSHQAMVSHSHVVQWLEVSRPWLLPRIALLGGQAVAFGGALVARVVAPRVSDAFQLHYQAALGRLLAHLLAQLDAGHLPRLTAAPASAAAQRLWNLEADATLRDVLVAMLREKPALQQTNLPWRKSLQLVSSAAQSTRHLLSPSASHASSATPPRIAVRTAVRESTEIVFDSLSLGTAASQQTPRDAEQAAAALLAGAPHPRAPAPEHTAAAESAPQSAGGTAAQLASQDTTTCEAVAPLAGSLALDLKSLPLPGDATAAPSTLQAPPTPSERAAAHRRGGKENGSSSYWSESAPTSLASTPRTPALPLSVTSSAPSSPQLPSARAAGAVVSEGQGRGGQMGNAPLSARNGRQATGRQALPPKSGWMRRRTTDSQPSADTQNVAEVMEEMWAFH